MMFIIKKHISTQILTLSILLCGTAWGEVTDLEWTAGSDTRIEFSDCARVERDEAAGVARVDRIFESPRGYRWDAPGARIRFATDSGTVLVRLRYSARHIGPARNSVGFFRIDGRGADDWRFDRKLDSGTKLPVDTDLELGLPAPGDGAFHDYELILPYGDAVELLGVGVEAGSKWRAPAARPDVRWVAFGDSVTQGFTATDIRETYAFRVAERRDWELVNQGIGGRACLARDGVVLSELDADLFTVAIGVNNWQAGTEPDEFARNLAGLLKNLRAGHPRTPVVVITPLWVPPAWQPKNARFPLEAYREAAAAVVSSRRNAGDEHVHCIDGTTLIDPDPALFDKVAVHPNDAGFAMMAERLATQLPKPEVKLSSP